MLNLDQFMNIRFLHRQGHSVREIARLTGHSRNTVRKLLRATRAPTPAPRVRPSLLDPYKPYLIERWKAHGLSAVRLHPEIQAQGFTGSAKRPRHRPRVRRQAFCWIAAGGARHSSTHDEDGKEIRVTTRKMLEDDDED